MPVAPDGVTGSAEFIIKPNTIQYPTIDPIRHLSPSPFSPHPAWRTPPGADGATPDGIITCIGAPRATCVVPAHPIDRRGSPHIWCQAVMHRIAHDVRWRQITRNLCRFSSRQHITPWQDMPAVILSI